MAERTARKRTARTMKKAMRMQKEECRMKNAECGTRPHVSRITHHVSRFTFHASRITPRSSRAFTLIELLIVIGVIAILAALTFPAVQGVKRSTIRTRARNEMTQLETAIERFQQKLGFYPPDNPGDWA